HEPRLARSTWPRRDRDVLLAADLEGHRRRGEARADIDLPELLQRRIVERRNRAVHQREEDKPAGGRERTRVVRIIETDGLFDLAGDRVDGGAIRGIAVGGFEWSAVPACGLAVLVGVDRDVLAVRQRANVNELGLLAVRRRPVVVAAGVAGTDLFGQLVRILVGEGRIDLDVLARV